MQALIFLGSFRIYTLITIKSLFKHIFVFLHRQHNKLNSNFYTEYQFKIDSIRELSTLNYIVIYQLCLTIFFTLLNLIILLLLLVSLTFIHINSFLFFLYFSFSFCLFLSLSFFFKHFFFYLFLWFFI